DGFLIEVESTFSRNLIELELSADYSKLGFELADHFDLAAASPTLDIFATATSNPLGSRIFLDDGIQASMGFLDVDGQVTDLSFSADGSLLFASMANGGVNVLAVSDSSLRRTAILADAGRIVSARSRDGRILTGSSQDEGKLIVWDPSTWLPVGSAHLPAGSGAITAITADAYGDLAYVGTENGLFTVDTALEAVPRASTDTTETAQIGVRSFGQNTAPEATETTRDLLEDGEDRFGSDSTESVQDNDGDRLWFTLATPPSNGQLHVDVDNNWRYEPAPNFAGSDSATLRVHDGQASTELVLRWDVEAVNDPPVAVHIQLPSIPENPEAGTSIGFISIEDPDQDAEYLVTTSDPRFAIQGGQIFFVDGELDFDAEPNVEFEIVATDITNSSYVISSETTLELTNVNEPATGLATDFEFAPENFAGAEFGLIQVQDPDADSRYEFELSDDRFEVVDGVLKLADNIALDFEQAGEIELAVTANEIDGDDSITEQVTVNVADGNDLPTGIRVSALEVIAGVDGAVIGTVSVEDQDGDVYDISVSDSRFEVADGLLKLRSGETLQGDLSQLPLTLSARARTGDQLSQTFPINVLPPPPPNQNPADRHDINGDGIVSPLDALFLINEINRGHGGPLPPRNGDSPYGD
ncbi:MAG: Ig-like domain-containing protein, partial [Planctomycetota bacterium]